MSGMPRPARVLVTGASGFLGRYLVRDLAEHGHTVVATGRNLTALRALGDAAADLIVGDLSVLPEHRTDVDAVIHAAALSTPWGRRADFERANVAGTRAALEFAHRNGARRFVLVSSPSVYAAPRDHLGLREADADPRNQLNEYIRSKLAAERLVIAAQARGVVPEAVILRPRGLIGVGDPSLVPRLLRVYERIGVPVFGDGTQLIDVTAVENVAAALRLSLDHGDPRAGTYNITNGDPRPFAALLDQLLDACGLPPRHRRLNRRVAYAAAGVLEGVCGVLPTRPEPPLTRYTVTTIAYAQTLDISAARADLGYEPLISLDAALERIGAAYRAPSACAGHPAAGAPVQQSAPDAASPRAGSAPVQAPLERTAPSAWGLARTAALHQGDAPARLTRYVCGSTHHELSAMFRGAPRERRVFPSACYLFDDGAGRRVLFDTGYAALPWDTGTSGALYRRLLPPAIEPHQTIAAQLLADGIDPGSVSHVVLSHAHPDHIGGLGAFPDAELLLSEGVAMSLHAPKIREGVLGGLLPDGWEARLQIVCDASFAPAEVAPGVTLDAFDPWGDGAYRLIHLPGHARGHLGALVDDAVLLAGDASWGAEFVPHARELRLVPRMIQHQPHAYARTASLLGDAAGAGLRVLFSHDTDDTRVVLP